MITIIYLLGFVWIGAFFFEEGSFWRLFCTGAAGVIWLCLGVIEIKMGGSIAQTIINFICGIGWSAICINELRITYGNRED